MFLISSGLIRGLKLYSNQTFLDILFDFNLTEKENAA